MRGVISSHHVIYYLTATALTVFYLSLSRHLAVWQHISKQTNTHTYTRTHSYEYKGITSHHINVTSNHASNMTTRRLTKPVQALVLRALLFTRRTSSHTPTTTTTITTACCCCFDRTTSLLA